MCGINGIVSKCVLNDITVRINRMNNSLFHRGPDAGGIQVLVSEHIAIGQRRLSIIDLDQRSNQPMKTIDGQGSIVFNGEIYNFQRLREDLEYTFFTDSDTEVLLAGLQCGGVEWLKKCNGMFAFAFYNAKKESFILGRDRFGIKPLYYYQNDDYFIFSSEIKGILNSGLVEAKFNKDAIDEYLGNRYVREPYTFFEEIYQLPAGCCLFLDKDCGFRIERFWDLPNEFNMSESYDEEEIYREFKNQVTKAISRRMLSDVPLGTYLSGGVDSSIISAICAQNAEQPINTYTIGFSNLNEFSYAREVAEKYGTLHHEIIVDNSDYFDKMEELISYKDAPLGVPNEIPLAIMSKELKKDITVVLSGEGADELMGGYGRIFRSPFDFSHIDSNYSGDFYDYFIDLYEYVPRKIRDKYIKTSKKIREEQDRKIKSKFMRHPNEENVFRFFHNYHVKGLLQRVDITTMYASVEARVPFLDHELVEFTYRNLPYALKLKWNSKKAVETAVQKRSSEYSEILDTPKYLIRRLGLELLPESVVTRKKMGFPVPLNEWYGEMEDMAKKLLPESGWFAYKKLDELLEDCRNNVRSGQLLWMFVNVEIFRKLYFEKEWRY